MAPAASIAIIPVLIIGLVLALVIGVVVALACSKVGRCVLAFGGLGLLAFAAVIGFFFLTTFRYESATAEREEFGPPRPPRAPIVPRVTLETARVVSGEPIVLAENSQLETAAPTADTAAPAADAPTNATAATEPDAAPIRKQTAGASRPAWMDEPTGKRGNEFHTIATAGPYATPQECREKLDEAIRDAVRHYVGGHLSHRSGVEIELPPSFIHNELVRHEWLVQSEYSFGPMYNLHALLVFDKTTNEAIDRHFHDGQVRGRLGYAGAGAALVLALVGTLFGYLKLDTLTRGYYTGRLRAAAAAAILALAAVAGLLVQGNIGF